MKEKIALSNKGGPAQERRNELLEELKKIRAEQGNIKQNRAKIFEQLNAMHENIQKKVRFVTRTYAPRTSLSLSLPPRLDQGA